MVKNSTWGPGHMYSWETVKSEILYSVSDSTVPGTMENWNYMQVETFWRAGTYRSPLSIHLSCSGTSCMGYESMPCMEKGGNPLLNWLLGYYKWPYTCWYGRGGRAALFYVLLQQARSQSCGTGSTACKCLWTDPKTSKSYTLNISNLFKYPWVVFVCLSDSMDGEP